MEVNFLRFKAGNRLTPVQILAVGFALVILIGTVLLTLPISSASGEVTNVLDSLFTATSAVCVTGLVTLDTGVYWSTFGQTVILLLIQIGGLGFMTFTTLVFMLLRRKITLKDRMVMQEAMNVYSLQGLVRMTKKILQYSLIIEGVGALLLSIRFIPEYGIADGIFKSIFHSVSAFCNAGFDLIGDFSSLTGYYSDPLVIIVASLLIILGSIGFFVWFDIMNYKKVKRVSLHSKVVLSMTAILVIGGAILMFLLEFNNPNTLGNMSMGDKWLNAGFAAISPRTAGFNSIALEELSNGGVLLTMILMFIGGSPGSTASGVKTVTVAVIIMQIVAYVKGKEDVEIFKRRIPKDTIVKSTVVIVIGIAIVCVSTMLLSIVQPHATFEQVAFEAISAFGTVGLSIGLTSQLTSVGKLIIIIVMYIGRVGPLTMALALTMTSHKKHAKIRYPEDKLLVG